MKKKVKQLTKIAVASVMLLTIVLSSGSVPKVFAGVSDVVVDNSSFAETLNESKWTSPNNDVTATDGKIVFSAKSTKDTRLITNKAIKANEYWDELLIADYVLNFKSIPSGKQFIAGFSLSNLESYSGEAGNVELVFENKGGLKVGLVAYDDNLQKTTLVAPRSVGASLGQNVEVSVRATKDMKLTIKINGNTIYDKKSPVDLTGRLGFLQTGACHVEVSRVNIVSHQYDRPENVNTTENFEKGTININAFTSFMNLSNGNMPALLNVREYNGSQVLMWENVGMGYFGTTHEYSNFEITFDVPYMLHNNIYRENGTILTKKSEGFVFSMGDDAADYEETMYDASGEAILFNSTSVRRLKGDKAKVDFSNKGYYDTKTNNGYSVKIRVVDTQATISLKALGAKSYDEMLTYKIGDGTPTGYLHIWAYNSANFAIDNVKIMNLDKDPNVIEVEYTEGFMKGTEDWVYEPEEVIYRDGTKPEQSTDKDASSSEKEDVPVTELIVLDNDEDAKNRASIWTWVAIGEIVISVAIVTTLIITIMKRKKEKEGGSKHEL